jgi:hypothetical protein
MTTLTTGAPQPTVGAGKNYTSPSSIGLSLLFDATLAANLDLARI